MQESRIDMSEQAENIDLASMDVYLLEPPSLILNTLEKLHVATIQDLLDLDMARVSKTRGVGKSKVEAIEALIERAKEALEEQDLHSLIEGKSTTRYIIDELIAVGIDPDTGWRELLGQLSTRTHNLLVRGELSTLREVVLRHEAGTLSRITGFGEATARELEEHLDRLVTAGPEGYIWGPKGKPEHFVDACERFLEDAEREGASLFRMRYADGMTLEEIGNTLSISRERVRQRLDRDMGVARRRWAGALVEWVEPISASLAASGGLLGKPRVEALLSGSGEKTQKRTSTLIWMLQMVLDLLEHRARWIASDEALTDLIPSAYEALWEGLREMILEDASESIPLSLLAQRAKELGWETTEDEVAYLAQTRWGAKLTADGDELVHPWQNLHALYAKLIKEVDGKITASELADLIQERLQLEKPPSERHIYNNLAQVDEVYYVDRGVYMHQDALPRSIQDLEAIAEELIDELEGTPHAVSARSLLDDYGKDQDVEHISPMLMRDIMGRDPRIQLFQATDMVAHLATFSGQRKTHLDHIDVILSDAQAPLTSAEVCDRMPEHVSFHQGAIYAALQTADFAINLGQGAFLHRDAIGLTEVMIQKLLAQAGALLMEREGPMTGQRLLEELTSPASAFLAAHEHGAKILAALLSREEGILLGSGQLLMRDDDASGFGDAWPVIWAIQEILGEHVVKTPSELLEEIEARHGWVASTGPLYYALELAEEAGIIERVFGKYRALANTDEDALFEALIGRGEAHSSVYTPARQAMNEDEDELARFERYLRANDLDDEAIASLTTTDGEEEE